LEAAVMIGNAIEWLKNPKNIGSWLITGYVLTLGGFILMHKYESAGRIIGFLGSLAIIVTLVRASLTKPLIGVLIVGAAVAYGWWYTKSVAVTEVQSSNIYEAQPWTKFVNTHKRPKYAESGIGQKAQEAIFAPAYMIDTVILSGRWKMMTEETRNPDYKAPKI
jgi:hypothetical protein